MPASSSSDFDSAADPTEELREIRTDLDEIVANLGPVWQRQARALEVRDNFWENQSDDGRKYDSDSELASPFNGASDARIPLVDSIVNDKVALCSTGFLRAEVQTTPIEPGDVAQASSVSTLLRWLRRVPMRAELQTEVPLSAQYMFGDDPGLAVVAVDWLQDTKLVRTPVSFDDLAAMYATGAATPAEADPALLQPEMLGDFMDLMTNRDRAREAQAWLGTAFPSVAPSRLRRLLRDLRRDGAADLPMPHVRANRPIVTALRYAEDVFFPLGTADIQRARRIHRREWLNDAELRERVTTMGWPADTVETIIAKGRGQSLVDDAISRLVGTSGFSLSGAGQAVNEHDNLFEIWWTYERRPDELGIAGIYLAVWNCAAQDEWLYAGLDDKDHGLYPFCVQPRERRGRQITDSRGLARPLQTHQQEIKVQRDARSNNTQMIASPPMKRRLLAGAAEIVLGPNADVPVQKVDDIELITMPPLTQASMEMEKTTRTEALDYAAILHADANPDRVFALTQSELDNFNALWASVFEQVLALCQQFYSPAELALITGGDAQPLGLGPDDIAGRWNVALEIDARDLNMEFVTKKLEMLTGALTLDSQGTLDRTLAPAWAAAAIFPQMADRMVQPAAKVTQRLIEEEQGNLAKMALGIEPAMPTEGIDAPATRLTALAETLTRSPQMAARYQADPMFQALLANRQKFLTQQVAQEQNKLIGRLGTAPMQGNAMGARAVGQAEALPG